MTKPTSRFIVFEGLDGAGTTTQTGLLHDYLTRNGHDSFRTFEPTDGPIGRLIRSLLDRSAGGDPPPETAMALLFAADRIAHSRQIEAALTRGQVVVCDRYIYSSMAYQSLDPSISGEWVIDANRGCTRPDLTLFVDVPVATGLQRVSARGAGNTIYEKSDLLETIAQNYVRLEPLYRENFGEVVHIDGTAPVSDVHHRVVDEITRLLT